jgi:hypothetical protein
VAAVLCTRIDARRGAERPARPAREAPRLCEHVSTQRIVLVVIHFGRFSGHQLGVVIERREGKKNEMCFRRRRRLTIGAQALRWPPDAGVKRRP